MELDHLAVSGETLEEAAAHIEEALGVTLQEGGRHALFSTHNRLLGLADGLYLEAIAADPAAPAPSRPRWFGLDDFAGVARLTNWVIRTGALDERLAELPRGTGEPVSITRGDLAWRMAVPADGRLPYDGVFPALIEWQGPAHPAQRLAPSGCRLLRLVIAHPDAASLAELMNGHITDPRVVVESGPMPELMAEFDTPHGRRSLQ
ncbi:VOC family protein [Aquicoccus sp. SCR17]|nr:VOC family protein [Carideicomes alvinocaridis]